MEQGLILSYTQLFMLAAAQGSDGIVGLPEYYLDIKADSLFVQIRDLMDLQLITGDGDGFVCTPEGAEIGKRLGFSKSYVVFQSNHHSCPDFCCYPGEKLMLCIPSMLCKDKAAVRFVTADEMMSMLLDEGYFPDSSERFEPDEKELKIFEMQFEVTESKRMLPDNDAVLFSAERRNVSGKLESSFKIVSYYYYYYIIICIHEKFTRVRLSAEAIENALKGLILQNDNR